MFLKGDRLVELENGAGSTTEEVEAWRALIVRGAVTDDVYDADVGDTWTVLEITRSARSRCGLAVIGQHGETPALVAACSSRTEAMIALRGRGFVGVADYAARALGE